MCESRPNYFISYRRFVRQYAMICLLIVAIIRFIRTLIIYKFLIRAHTIHQNSTGKRGPNHVFGTSENSLNEYVISNV